MILLPRQQFTGYGVFGTQYHVALNEVFQLADISRPRVVFKELHRFGRERPGLNVVPGSMSFEEICHQTNNILGARA